MARDRHHENADHDHEQDHAHEREASPLAPSQTPGKLQTPLDEGLARLRQVAGNFAANVPPAARDGEYVPPQGSTLAVEELSVRDGIYRVSGQDWLFHVESRHVKVVSRAVGPDYGGPNVVSLPN